MTDNVPLKTDHVHRDVVRTFMRAYLHNANPSALVALMREAAGMVECCDTESVGERKVLDAFWQELDKLATTMERIEEDEGYAQFTP